MKKKPTAPPRDQAETQQRFDRLLQVMAGVSGQKSAEAPGTSRKAQSEDCVETQTRQGKKASASRKRARKSR